VVQYEKSSTYVVLPRGGRGLDYISAGGLGIVVGIASGYWLDGPGIESRWGGEIFRACPDRPWGPPSLLYNG
jgi:hypothetical protein